MDLHERVFQIHPCCLYQQSTKNRSMNEFQSKFFRIFHLPEQCSVDFQKKDKHHVDYVVAKHWPMSPLYRSVSLNSMINSSFLCRVVEHGVLSHDGTSDEKFSTVLMNKFGVNSPHLFYSSENTSLCVFLQSMKKKKRNSYWMSDMVSFLFETTK